MNPPLYSSLLAKFLLASALPLLLLLIFANVVYVLLKTDELRERHLEDVSSEIQLLATQLSIPVWQFDRETVKSIVGSLEGAPYIICARLDEYESYSDKVRQSSVVGKCSDNLADSENFDKVSAEVTYNYDGQVIKTGIIQAHLDLSRVGDSLAKSLFNELILFFFYVLIFLVGFTVALKSTVLKPLQMVRTSIKSYQHTGKRALVEWKSKDELGTLIEEYNKNLIRMDEAEQALLDKNVVLDGARQEAEEARDVAEQTARAKSEFLANMSHEIRTPMNAIQGLTEMMSRTRLDVKQGGYLHRIRNSADILLAIINDILDFSKIEAGKLELEEVDFSLGEVIEKVADVESFTAVNKGIDLIFKLSPSVPDRLRGDPMRLSQVLINLISNAIKFTEKGEIIVGIDMASRDGHKIILEGSVADTGVGIADSALSSLFDSFTQADGSTTRRFGGTGLGLTICKRLVELMNGEISVTSKVGGGSKFTFTADFEIVPGKSVADPLDAFKKNPPSVVVVGDSRSCDELYTIFSQTPLHVQRMHTGAEALTHLLSLSVDQSGLNSSMVIYVDIESVRLSLSELTDQIALLENPDACRLVPILSGKQRDEVEAGIDNPHIASLMTKPVLGRRAISSFVEAMTDQNSTFDKRQVRGYGAHDLTGVRILVVEDNQINQLVAREMLESVGAIVRVADDGKQALTRLQDQSISYDAVLMDVHMPVMDGYDATKAIREKYGNRLPIIALTANATTDEKKRCLAIGMSDFLTKPIDSDRLFSVLAHWVGLVSDEKKDHISSVSATIAHGMGASASRSASGPRESGLVGDPHAQVASKANDAMASDKVISIEDLEIRFKGHPTIIPRVFVSFEESFRNFENQFMDAAEASDDETMYRLAHSLKGSAANISAERLRDLASQLEEKLRLNQKIEAMEWLPWVVDHLSKVNAFIKRYLAEQDKK